MIAPDRTGPDRCGKSGARPEQASSGVRVHASPEEARSDKADRGGRDVGVRCLPTPGVSHLYRLPLPPQSGQVTVLLLDMPHPFPLQNGQVRVPEPPHCAQVVPGLSTIGALRRRRTLCGAGRWPQAARVAV